MKNPAPNAFFAAQFAMRSALNRQRKVQAGMRDSLTVIADAVSDPPDCPPPPNNTVALKILSDKLDQINNSLLALDHSETDFVTALYAAVVDTSGVIVDRTNAGRWIVNAWPAVNAKGTTLTICDIGGLRDTRKVSAYRKFVDTLIASRDHYPGLSQKLIEADIRRFVRLAPGVCDAITALQQAAPAEGAADIPPTTA